MNGNFSGVLSFAGEFRKTDDHGVAGAYSVDGNGMLITAYGRTAITIVSTNKSLNLAPFSSMIMTISYEAYSPGYPSSVNILNTQKNSIFKYDLPQPANFNDRYAPITVTIPIGSINEMVFIQIWNGAGNASSGGTYKLYVTKIEFR